MKTQSSSPHPWPEAPALAGPVIMDQRWTDALFLHWRLPEATAAAFMPAGVVPDVFDGSSWVGLIGFRMRQAGLGRGPAVPFFGDFNEVNVRLYSREPDGTRGVVFLSLDANRLAVAGVELVASSPLSLSWKASPPILCLFTSPPGSASTPGSAAARCMCPIRMRPGPFTRQS